LRVMDIVEVPLIGHRPDKFQSENWLLDPNREWVNMGQLDWDELGQLVDPVGPLWHNGDCTRAGLNDCIPAATANTLQSSLRFLTVQELTFSVFAPGEGFGNRRRRVQGRFRYGRVNYWLWVTDPLYEETYLNKPDGEYEIEDCFITVSVAKELYRGAHYKLIAAVIEHGDPT